MNKKQSQFKNCINCGKGMAHGGNFQFYTMQIKSFLIDLNACRRQAGLEMQIGPLAGVMGPNEDLGKQVTDSEELFVCAPCMHEHGYFVMTAAETATEEQEEQCKK